MHAVGAAINEMVIFSGQFVRTIYVHRDTRMFFINRKILRHTVNLSGTCEDNLDRSIFLPARVEQAKLRTAIHFEIGLRVAHRIEMRSLARQIEKDVLITNES